MESINRWVILALSTCNNTKNKNNPCPSCSFCTYMIITKQEPKTSSSLCQLVISLQWTFPSCWLVDGQAPGYGTVLTVPWCLTHSCPGSTSLAAGSIRQMNSGLPCLLFRWLWASSPLWASIFSIYNMKMMQDIFLIACGCVWIIWNSAYRVFSHDTIYWLHCAVAPNDTPGWTQQKGLFC